MYELILVVMFLKAVCNIFFKRIALQNGTEGYEMWKDMPIPLKFEVYLFNVTNPEEIATGAKPILNEVGPYVYSEQRIKSEINVESSDTISFNLKKIFIFNQNESYPLTENDMVTVLNVALVGMVVKVNKMMPSALSTVEQVIPTLFNEPTDPFLRAKVGDLLFNGVFLNCSSENNQMVGLVCNVMKGRLPKTIVPGKDDEEGFYFSMFHHMNDTWDGPFVVQRGIDEPGMLGNIVSYKNKTTLDIWQDGCEVLKGSDTTIFAPLSLSNVPQRIYIFQPDVCRIMYAEFMNVIDKSKGFDTFRYEATKNVLGSNKTNPENGCFCTENWSLYKDGCSLDGVQNLEPCQDSPVIASFPHFYLADPSLLDYADGLSPNEKEHTTYVHIEPLTGTPTVGHKRVQFNIELQQIPEIDILSEVNPGLFPVMWVDESGEVNDEILSKVKALHNNLYLANITGWTLIIMGLCVLIFEVYKYLRHFRKTKVIILETRPSPKKGIQMPVYGMSMQEQDSNARNTREGSSNKAFVPE